MPLTSFVAFKDFEGKSLQIPISELPNGEFMKNRIWEYYSRVSKISL